MTREPAHPQGPESPERPAERAGRYRRGEMGAAEQAAFEREVLVDRELAEMLYEETALDGVLDEAARARAASPARGGGAHWRWVPLALAAAAVGVVLVWRTGPEREPVLRDGAAPFVTLEPSGEAAGDPVVFRWTRDPRAARYRVEWIDGAGALVLRRESADTTLAVPAAELAGVHGVWRVVPLDADGFERPPTPPAPFRPDSGALPR